MYSFKLTNKSLKDFKSKDMIVVIDKSGVPHVTHVGFELIDYYDDEPTFIEVMLLENTTMSIDMPRKDYPFYFTDSESCNMETFSEDELLISFKQESKIKIYKLFGIHYIFLNEVDSNEDYDVVYDG